MLKKILFIILIILNTSCDYKPIHLNKENSYEITTINVTGDDEINEYLVKELMRKSKKSNEKVKLKINTNFSKRVLAKNTKSFATDYELKVTGNFELINDEKSQSFIINEKFRYKNLNDNYEQSNYEKMIKINLANIILSKINLKINNLR
tara:strand:+ start:6960 stop:7409 length:450 start_codon:yes stop_codon:yes gene_type:complete